jgi:putative ABC transport system ATP-binding protein
MAYNGTTDPTDTNLHAKEEFPSLGARTGARVGGKPRPYIPYRPCPVGAVIGYQGRDKPLPLRRIPLVHEQQTIVQKSIAIVAPTQAAGMLVATNGKQAPVVAVRNLTKTYGVGKKTLVHALRDISLEVAPGEFVAVLGPSGSGKSTFMNLLGCLDQLTNGEYWLADRLVSNLSSDELANIRNQLLGFVFQRFNLLEHSTALKNVMLPMIYAGLSKQEQEQRARKALTLMGLGTCVNHKPPELSAGQQQRVAIARALVNGPSLLLADEPTGNLDSRTSVEILAMLQALNDQGLTIVLATHDLEVANYAKRQIAFLDGLIVRDELVSARRSAHDEMIKLLKEGEGENTVLTRPQTGAKEEAR